MLISHSRWEGKGYYIMKVEVITRHAITNYGSLLQTIATQQVISNLGHSCEIIDYIREDESYYQHEKTILKRKKNWSNSLLKKVLYLAIRQPESIAAGRKFENAQKKYLKLTARYATAKKLKENPPIADVYMTGSDQVWGPVENGSYDDCYCLSFSEGKKIAYAASFGHTEMTAELSEYYKKWLSKYKYIAVREDSACRILNDLGIDTEQVLDPTLLLDSSYWNQYLKPIKYKKYILVYQLHNDKKLGRYAQQVARAKGLPLVRVSTAFHQIVRSGRFIWCPEMGEFLSYIKNAECMITDSFHGTAFAILFNTSFVEVLPNNNTGTRNISILKLTGLSDRILKDERDTEKAMESIDFSYVNGVLKRERMRSLQILKKMIET